MYLKIRKVGYCGGQKGRIAKSRTLEFSKEFRVREDNGDIQIINSLDPNMEVQ